MRAFDPAPASAYDESAGAFRIGSYRGRIDRADLSRAEVGRLGRAVREKRWVYTAIITDDLVIACAVVHLGYASKWFFHAFERTAGNHETRGRAPKMLCRGEGMGTPFSARVLPVGKSGVREVAAFGRVLTMERNDAGFSVRLSHRGKMLDAHATPGAESLTAIANIPGGVVNVTEKSVLMPLTGSFMFEGRTYDLKGGYLAIDHTSGLLARHTAWKWALGMGTDRNGKPFALNVTSGFVGEAECAVWSGRDLIALSEPRFSVGDESTRWKIESDELALECEEHARHQDHTNLGLVRARFIQAIATFRGTVKTSSGAIELANVIGMVEAQDVRW